MGRSVQQGSVVVTVIVVRVIIIIVRVIIIVVVIPIVVVAVVGVVIAVVRVVVAVLRVVAATVVVPPRGVICPRPSSASPDCGHMYALADMGHHYDLTDLVDDDVRAPDPCRGSGVATDGVEGAEVLTRWSPVGAGAAAVQKGGCLY